MATRKRPPDSGSQPHRPQPHRLQPGRSKPSLREQLEALPPMDAPPSSVAPAPGGSTPARPQTNPPSAPPKPEGPSFRELAADVRRLPEPARPVLPAAPAPPVTRAVAAKSRLWVELRDGVVRALADGVPSRLLDELGAGKVVPRRELDLHRRSAAEARQMLEDGVPRARREGVSCLLVVCGRGVHSGSDGPVLPEVAVEWLSEELADEILAFCTAPRQWGGQGALLVRLRAPPGGG